MGRDDVAALTTLAQLRSCACVHRHTDGVPTTLPQRVLRSLAEARSAGEAIDATLAEVVEGLNATVAVLWLFDADNAVLLWNADFAGDAATAEFRAISRRLAFALGDGLPGRVAATGEPEVVEDLGTDPDFARSQAALAAGLGRGIAAPLVGRDGVIGVIEAFAPHASLFSLTEADALDGASRQLAAYLGRVNVEERLQASEERHAAVVAAALDCVITMDHEGRVLDFNPAAEATFGFAREDAVGESLAELIIPPELREAHRRGLETYLAERRGRILDTRLELTAMRRSGEVIPVELTVTRLGSTEPPMFAGFVRDISDRHQVEAENARLLAERTYIAETLQRSLLPRSLPAIEGFEVAARYRAAGEQYLVGGDFYDLFESEPGVWTALIGDVSGKGPEAAAITALSRHTLRAGALRGSSPSADLALLNDALLAARDRDWRFATVLCTRISHHGDHATVTLSTGGHLPPLVLRADGTIEELPIRGTVLGIMPEPRLVEQVVRLEPGDLMLFYTDGVTEVRPGEPGYGDRLLRQVLGEHGTGSVDDLAAAIERAATCAQAGEPRDDIALIALRVAGSVTAR